MSNISNFRDDKADLPIGSLKQVVTGNNMTNVANTTSLVDNGLWIPTNAVYAKSAYPELFSQLGQLSARSVTELTSVPMGFEIFDYNIANRMVYGNGLYVLGGPYSFSTSTNLINWTLRGTGTTSSITDITYGNNLYVYSGFGGVVGTSTNKLDWTVRTSGTTSTIYAIEYGTGLFVLAGLGGMIRTSTDGITWAAATSGTTSQLNALVYNNGLFVVGGNGGVIRTSTDGTTWTARTSGTASSIFGMVYGDGRYVVVGAGGMSRTSTDGITWTAVTTGTTVPLYTVGYGNGYYVTAGGDGFSSNGYRTSTNLVTWTAVNNGSLGFTSDTINSVGFYKGFYYFAGQIFTGHIRGIVSPLTAIDEFRIGSRMINGTIGAVRQTNDELFIMNRNGGMSFTNVAFVNSGTESFFNPIFSSYAGLSYTNGLFLDSGGGTGIIFTSNNGINWAQTDLLNVEMGAQQLYTLSYDQRTGYTNGIYYALFGWSIFTSTDGYSWSGRNGSMSNEVLNDFAYGNDQIVYFSNNSQPLRNKIVQNRVGFTKNVLANISAPNLVKSIYGNGLFVYAGAGGTLRTSTDSITWFTRTSGTTSTILTLTYGNGIYLYGAINGVLASSTDGTTWSLRTSGTTSSISSLTYGNGIYVYGANNGVLASSTDGTTWTARTSGTTSSIRALTYGNSTYVYAGDGGVLASSTDGTTWTARTSGTTESIRALAYGNGTFVYSGNNSTIASSTNAITWVARNSGTLQKNLNRLLYANSIFYYLSGLNEDGVGTSNLIGTSTDGINWFPYNAGIPINSTALDLFFKDGEYVLAYYDGGIVPAGIRFKVTTDFNTWTEKYGVILNVTPSGISPPKISYGNGYYVISGSSLCVSKDLIKWYTIPNIVNGSGLVYSDGVFTVMLPNSGGVYSCAADKNPIYKESWVLNSTVAWSTMESGNNQYLFVADQFGSPPIKRIGVSSNPELLTMASYDIANNFYVPALTNQGVYTVTTGTIPLQQTFIKAKM